MTASPFPEPVEWHFQEVDATNRLLVYASCFIAAGIAFIIFSKLTAPDHGQLSESLKLSESGGGPGR